MNCICFIFGHKFLVQGITRLDGRNYWYCSRCCCLINFNNISVRVLRVQGVLK